MFGRMFGRGKDEPDQAVCAECSRTLLAGEWTQKVVDADGEELLLCSLCGQTHALSGAEPVATSPTPANAGRVRESREKAREPRAEARDPRTESDAFWTALKDKDAEIERLQAQLAHVEAEKQELAGQLARSAAARPRSCRRRPSGRRRRPCRPHRSSHPRQAPRSPRLSAEHRRRATPPSPASAPGARRPPSSPPSWRRCATKRRRPRQRRRRPTSRRSSRLSPRCRPSCSKTRSRSRRSPKHNLRRSRPFADGWSAPSRPAIPRRPPGAASGADRSRRGGWKPLFRRSPRRRLCSRLDAGGARGERARDAGGRV